MKTRPFQQQQQQKRKKENRNRSTHSKVITEQRFKKDFDAAL